MSSNPFWQHWHYHLPNYVLAALFYTLVGRFLLSLIVPADTKNYIQRWFVRLTEPVVRVVGWITPALVPAILLPLVAAVWLTLLRLALWIWLGPSLGPAS
jgi:uncharacterized protein YggT (Ycf19 family)